MQQTTHVRRDGWFDEAQGLRGWMQEQEGAWKKEGGIITLIAVTTDIWYCYTNSNKHMNSWTNSQFTVTQMDLTL